MKRGDHVSQLSLNKFLLFFSLYMCFLVFSLFLESSLDILGVLSQELQHRLTKACQHRFVGLVDYLPYTGLKELVADVQQATEQVVGRFAST